MAKRTEEKRTIWSNDLAIVRSQCLQGVPVLGEDCLRHFLKDFFRRHDGSQYDVLRCLITTMDTTDRMSNGSFLPCGFDGGGGTSNRVSVKFSKSRLMNECMAGAAFG